MSQVGFLFFRQKVFFQHQGHKLLLLVTNHHNIDLLCYYLIIHFNIIIQKGSKSRKGGLFPYIFCNVMIFVIYYRIKWDKLVPILL